MKTVSLFVTCLGDALAPEVGESAVRVLNRCGVKVDFEERQTCCGQPALNSGYPREAKDLAARFLALYEHAETIVAPSGSCAAMIRHEYPRLFRDDAAMAQKAESVAKRTYEFSEYLDLFTTGSLGRLPRRVGYHTSCHMRRSLGVTDAPMRILSRVEELNLATFPFEEECCGFGGIFAVKMGNLSAAIGSAKLRYADSAGIDELVSGDMGCLLHLEGRAEAAGPHLPMRHIAQLLDEAMTR